MSSSPPTHQSYTKLALCLTLALPLSACSAETDADNEDRDITGSTGGEAAVSPSGGTTSAGGGNSTGGSGTGGNTASAGGTLQTTGGSGTGGQGTVAPDPCAEGDWSCVVVEPEGPYGTMNIEVPANQNWVNTGLFLKKGEQATVTVTGGSWTVDETGNAIDHGNCKIGDMVARLGLHYKDTALICVSGSTTVTADKDGILFLGALAGNDLGETYESRLNATGSKFVTVQSTGATVPTVQGADAADYPFDVVASGWVEVWGEHVILTLPASIADTDASTLAAATKRLDDIYDLEEELRGAVPHNGQRLRFFPDGTQPGYMLAGNPIRMALDLVNGDDTTRISRAGEPGTGNWGFAHEMGHDFSFVGGFWSYQQNSIEVWCNVFSMYATEKLGLPENSSISYCNASSTGSYGSGSWSPWTGLCFLMQFQYKYGWDFYKNYFRDINQDQSMPWHGSWDATGWYFVHNKFEAEAGEDVTPLFDDWDLPHP